MNLTRFSSEFLNASIWQNFLTELLRNWAFVYKINKVYWHKKSEAITEKKNVLNLDKKASNRFLLTLKSPFDIFLAAKQQKNFSHSLVKTLPMSQVCVSWGHKNVPSHNKNLSNWAVPIQSTVGTSVSVKNSFWSNVTNSDSLTSSSISTSSSKLSRVSSKSTLGRWQCNFDYQTEKWCQIWQRLK